MPWLLRESFFYNHLNAPRPCTRTRRHATDGPRLLALALLSSVCGRIRRIWEPSCSTSHGRIARASPDRAPAWSGRSTSIKEGRRSDLLSPHHRRRCFPEHFRWRFGALPERPGHRTGDENQNRAFPRSDKVGSARICSAGHGLYGSITLKVSVPNHCAARAAESQRFD